MAGRIGFAEQDIGNRFAAALPRIPGFDHRRCLCKPWHGDRIGRLQHHDGLRIGRGDRGDQRVLPARQCHIGKVVAFDAPLIGENDDDIRPFRRRHGGGDIAAVIEFHLCGRRCGANGLQRR